MGCCGLLLYGTIGTSKNTVKVALTLALPHSRLRGGQMTTWEYRTLMWSSRTSEDWESGMKQLNDLGMQGWEAVNMIRDSVSFNTVLLKRPC